MLSANQEFNYRSIGSFTAYACHTEACETEREISFHTAVGPSTERRGDVFPVYEVPKGRMVWLSDWSFNTGGPLDRTVSIGGSLGRITTKSEYVYVLNCSVSGGAMEIYSPARAIRYLPGEWIAVCFHHMGAAVDILARATFRLTEVSLEGESTQTEFFEWTADRTTDRFPGFGSKEKVETNE